MITGMRKAEATEGLFMKRIMPRIAFVAGAFFLTACAGKTTEVQTRTTEETELSSDFTVTEDTSMHELTETASSAEVSRIEKLVRMAGYDEGEPKLSEEPAVTVQYSDEDFEYYRFFYNGTAFEVLHEYDNWKIIDSYKIRNSEDMQLICSALINIYPVHGADLESYRTPEDMVYEWIEHNIVYEMPISDTSIRENAASVDLDPKDQNKTLFEILEDRSDVDVNGRGR